MSYGFKLWTGPGREIVVDENTPPPGLIIDEVPLFVSSNFTLDYSSAHGISQVFGFHVRSLQQRPATFWTTDYIVHPRCSVTKTGNKTLQITSYGNVVGDSIIVVGF